MKRALSLLLIVLIFIGYLPIQAETLETGQKKKVLVLDSYHAGLFWSDELEMGIQEGLKDENLEITIEYMDSYRYNNDTYFKQLYLFYYKKYKEERFDAIIVCDNFANDFMKLYYESLFSGIPVVFGGINNYSEKDLFTENSTGIAQTSSQEDTIKLVLKLHPKVDTLIVCGAISATAIAEAEAIVNEGKKNHTAIYFKSELRKNFDELLVAVEPYGPNTAIIVAGTMKTRNGDFLDHASFSSLLIEKTGLPVYAMASCYIVDEGAIGGLAVDSYEHGKIIADFTKKILSGIKASDITIIDQPVAQYTFNYHRLQEFNITEAHLPKGSIILGGPSTKVTVNKKVFYSTIAILLVMILLVVGFLINLSRRKRAEKRLEVQNVELEASNEFLKNSTEKLNKQYDELTEKNERIEFLAFYDTLTHLMKRDKLREMLAEYIHNNKLSEFAIYNVDLGNIKTINDSYGHHVGNEILIQITQLIKDVVIDRSCMIGMHHNEFLIVDFNSKTIDEALYQSNGILVGLQKTFKVSNKEIDLETNIGISLYPLHGTDAISLLTNANIAMMEAIKNGKNSICVYKESFYTNIINRLEMEKQLKKALQYQEFELFYQPKVDSSKCEIVGCEALIRWRHPEGNLVYPAKFIEMAEETGSIIPIGDWVIYEACRQIKAWQLMGLHMQISVNVSARQFTGTHLLEVIQDALQINEIEADLLEIEITETAMMRDVKHNALLLSQIKALGVGIAIDDFGTGYSSMNYIKEFPITKLKIDKSFIDNIEEVTQREIIKSIIDLGQALNYVINIEGVERLEQFKILQVYKANEIQGFLFSRALPKDEFVPYVQNFKENFTAYYE